MAEWKKVVVSGSNITQLNNDANYIAQDDSGVSLSGSFSGSFFGDGSGLSGVSATFPVTQKTPLAGTTQVFVSDGTSKYATIAQFNSASWTPVSGDATISSTGVLTIATDSVEGTMLNTNVADGTTIELSSDTLSVLKVPNALTAGSGLASNGTFDGAAARRFTVDSGSMATYFRQNAYSNVSGDATIASNGVITVLSASIADGVATNSVALGTDTTGNYVATLGTLTGLTTSGNTGEGSTPTLSVTYGSSANQAVQGNTTITINVASGELTRDVGTAAQALGGGPSYTLGLADTITGARTFSGAITISNDLSVTGDLTVSGTVSSLETTNLNVKDQFILLNSGSAAADAGIVINGASSAFGWDQSAGRWAFDYTGATWNQTSITPDAYAAAVVTSADANYQKNGNIRVEGGEIYIYVE